MGDTAAQQQLIMANLALVVRAVRDYKRSGIPLEDLVQEGNLGLIRAAQSFDPSAHTARFATYARFWIHAALVRALAANGSLIRIPERSHLLRLRYRRAIDELRSRVPEGGDAPSPEPPSLDEIASHLGVSANRLKWAGKTRCHCTLRLRLGELMLAAGPPPDQDVVKEEDRALVYVALRRLSPFEAWVIRERYGLDEPAARQGIRSASRRQTNGANTAGRAPLPGYSGAPTACSPQRSQTYYARTYGEIGDDCGLSVHRVSQVEKIALKKLRGLLSPQLVEAMCGRSRGTNSPHQAGGRVGPDEKSVLIDTIAIPDA